MPGPVYARPKRAVKLTGPNPGQPSLTGAGGRARVARATVSAGLVLLLWIGVLFGQAVLASPGPYSPPFAIASLQARVHEVQPYWLPVGENVTARPVSWEDIGVVSRDSSLASPPK